MLNRKRIPVQLSTRVDFVVVTESISGGNIVTTGHQWNDISNFYTSSETTAANMPPTKPRWLTLTKCASPLEVASPDFCINDDKIDEDCAEDSDSEFDVPFEDELELE